MTELRAVADLLIKGLLGGAKSLTTKLDCNKGYRTLTRGYAGSLNDVVYFDMNFAR
jgi:hypothetical protein